MRSTSEVAAINWIAVTPGVTIDQTARIFILTLSGLPDCIAFLLVATVPYTRQRAQSTLAVPGELAPAAVKPRHGFVPDPPPPPVEPSGPATAKAPAPHKLGSSDVLTAKTTRRRRKKSVNPRRSQAMRAAWVKRMAKLGGPREAGPVGRCEQHLRSPCVHCRRRSCKRGTAAQIEFSAAVWSWWFSKLYQVEGSAGSRNTLMWRV